MPKLAFLIVILALAVSVQGFPTFEDDVAAAAASGNWAKVHEILRKSFKLQPYQGIQELNGDIRSLQPPAGGHVFAEAQSSFQQSSNYNGQINHQSGGHKVVNEDGKVREWDYKP